MQLEFWQERWARNQIGFHQEAINLHLESFWPRLQAAPQACVFVPLCGKSRDLLWLRAQGNKVLGVEVSRIAVEAFFAEHELQVTVTQRGAFECWESDGLVILCGDFFDLQAEDVAACSVVYDRASLIALPPDMRQQYVNHLLEILAPATRMLLITLSYDQSLADGPPFSVKTQEVYAYYEAWFRIELVRTVDALDDLPGFKRYGIEQIDESVFLLQPR